MSTARPFLAGAAALVLSGAAIAQEQTISDYVRGMIAARPDDDERLVGDIVLDEIAETESLDVSFAIDPDKTYFVYAACDDDCVDIDMVAVDSDGLPVDYDEEDDSEPLLMILPGEAGEELRVAVDMIACETDVCVVGVALYEVAD